jgi:hypothetical protein
LLGQVLPVAGGVQKLSRLWRITLLKSGATALLFFCFEGGYGKMDKGRPSVVAKANTPSSCPNQETENDTYN